TASTYKKRRALQIQTRILTRSKKLNYYRDTKPCLPGIMKKLLPLLPSLLIALGASGSLPLYEPIADQTANGGTAYAVGDNLAGQINSTNANGTMNIWNLIGSTFPGGQPTNAAGNLSYPNLPPPTGNSVEVLPIASMSGRLN